MEEDVDPRVREKQLDENAYESYHDSPVPVLDE